MASTFASPNANLTSPTWKPNWGLDCGGGARDYQSPPTSTSESSTPGGKSPEGQFVKSTAVETNSNGGNNPQIHRYHHPRPSQLYPRHGPLYVPAALRPTEPPTKQSPPKHGIKPFGKSHSSPPTPPRSADGPGDNEEAFKKLFGREGSKNTMIRTVADEWRDFETVPGPPTNQHWKPDFAATECDFASCSVTFSIFQRRHHCRRCGHIFCSQHSLHLVPLEGLARIHARGTWQRACDCCWQDYKILEAARKERKDSKSSGSVESGSTTPKMNIATAGQTASGQPGTVPGAQDIGEPGSALERRTKRHEERLEERPPGEHYFGSYCGGLTWSTF